MGFRRKARGIGLLGAAAFAALNLFAAPADGQGGGELHPAVVFSFDTPASAGIWPSIAQAFAREALDPRQNYPLPADTELLPAFALHPGSEFGRAIQVHLLGRCDVAEQAFRPLGPGPLGWVRSVSGEIQPFVYVDCARLAQFLDAKVLGMDDEQRVAAMSTAIARITIHEWLHITLQSAAHTDHGIRRAELTPDDLVQLAPSSAGN
ncbi:hypothetical protein HNQ77_003436 [Silvibacterium bohemicum]|uniref:Uncharacterized protein n=1 Tax=Silvibacterium bohemicum TaxID=1577686 RepID=A0A841JXY8_9BACT|nr:hypothetical protein [Silvibacterium bohemicum]MBB6145475.1 hypothetical protein [Silvibacterium bohemicum]